MHGARPGGECSAPRCTLFNNPRSAGRAAECGPDWNAPGTMRNAGRRASAQPAGSGAAPGALLAAPPPKPKTSFSAAAKPHPAAGSSSAKPGKGGRQTASGEFGRARFLTPF